jgi:hypothetical protein
MKVKLILLVLTLLTSGILSAQPVLIKQGFFPGTLHYKNGQIKTTYVSAPKKPGQSAIYTWDMMTSKEEKIPSELLDSISLTTPQGATFCFENLAWSMKEDSKIRKPQWFFTVVRGYASLYVLSDVYIINGKGNAYIVTYSVGHFGSEIYYMIRKQNDKHAYYFGYSSTFGPDRISQLLQRSATHYLSEDKDLVDKITKTYQLSDRDAEEIINSYNAFMSQKK